MEAEEDLELDDLKQENCKICKSNFQTEYGVNTHQFCESGNSCNKRKFKQQNKDIFNKHKLNQRTFLYYCENCDSNYYKRIRTFLCDFNIRYECKKWTTNLRSHVEDEKNDAFDDLLNTPEAFAEEKILEHFQTLKLNEIPQRKLLSLNWENLIFLFDYNTFIFKYLFTGQKWTELKFNKNLQIENLTRQGLESKSLNHGHDDCYSASYNY